MKTNFVLRVLTPVFLTIVTSYGCVRSTSKSQGKSLPSHDQGILALPGSQLGTNIKYPLTPENYGDLKEYFQACDKVFDFKSFGELSCSDLREVKRLHVDSDHKIKASARRVEEGSCFNPDGAGIAIENKTNCSTGRMMIGQYNGKNPNQKLVLSCDAGEVHLLPDEKADAINFAVAAIFFDSETRQACFISVGRATLEEKYFLDPEKRYFRPLTAYLAGRPSQQTCVYCHTPGIYTRSASLADAEIASALEKRGHKIGDWNPQFPLKPYTPPPKNRKPGTADYRLVPKAQEILETMTTRQMSAEGRTSDRRQSWDLEVLKVEDNSLIKKTCMGECHDLSAARYGARLALTLFGLCESSEELQSCRGYDDTNFKEFLPGTFIHNLQYGSGPRIMSEALKAELYNYAKNCILPANRGANCPSKKLSVLEK